MLEAGQDLDLTKRSLTEGLVLEWRNLLDSNALASNRVLSGSKATHGLEVKCNA